MGIIQSKLYTQYRDAIAEFMLSDVQKDFDRYNELEQRIMKLEDAMDLVHEAEKELMS